MAIDTRILISSKMLMEAEEVEVIGEVGEVGEVGEEVEKVKEVEEAVAEDAAVADEEVVAAVAGGVLILTAIVNLLYQIGG